MSNQSPATPPGLAPLEIAHDPEYVLGYPALAAITLRCDRPGASLSRLPYADFRGTNGFIGLSLSRAGQTDLVSKVEPLTVVDEDLGHATFTLGPGEAHRILVDISAFLPPVLPAGEYKLSLSYGHDNGTAVGPAAAVRFRAPDGGEAAILEKWAPEMREAGSWTKWLRKRPGDLPALHASIPPDGPLGFFGALRYLIHTPKLSPGDMRILAAMHGTCQPEAAALQAEVEKEVTDDAGFASQATKVRRDYPALSWMLVLAEQGEGILATSREMAVK